MSATAVAPSRKIQVSPATILTRGGTLIALGFLIVVFSALKPHTFPTWANTLTILTQASLLGIVAGGLTICLILGEFDLSIGYSVTLGGVVAAKLLTSGVSVPLCVLAALAAGLAVGVVNGVIVAYGRVNAFIVTLGTGSIILGLVLLLSGGQSVILSQASFLAIGQNKVIGVPLPVVFSGAVLIALWLFITKTELGRRIDAVGGSSEAARLSGIRVPRTRLVGFVISALCAAGAGVLLTAQLGSAYTTAGDTFLLQAFTACFLGAVTMRENEFHIGGTVVGVLIMAVTFNGLAQLGVAAYWTNIAQGVILVGAVSISAISGRISFQPRRRRAQPVPS